MAWERKSERAWEREECKNIFLCTFTEKNF
jgi:hypothetical protein